MKAHIIGICGTGMAAVADLLLGHGWEVTGSDEGFYPPISTYLQTRPVTMLSPYAASNIPDDVDTIIIGKHAKLVPDENEEVKAAFASGKSIKSFPDVLEELTAHTKNFVVAGSFGKSTNTALTTWALMHAKKDPSYFVPALCPNLDQLGYKGKGYMFVLEGDEYPSANWDNSSKFLHYNASTLLLTSCTHDHLNVFPTLESYLAPFEKLLTQLPNDGIIVACLEGEHVTKTLAKAKRTAITYSLNNPTADWWAEDITRDEMTSFTLVNKGKKIAQLKSRLLGDHNVLNMVGVAAWLLSNHAVTAESLEESFASFAGIRRRLELRTQETSIPVYEDYGSSPAKLLAGLNAIRAQFPHKKIRVLFEPHTFSFRNRAILPQYLTLFDQADSVFVFQPPTHGASTHDQLTQQEIVDQIASTGKKVRAFTSKEELEPFFQHILQPHHDVILMETSGEMGGALNFTVDYVTEHFSKA